MRVWDIHPGYLSGRSLLGQHAEIHAVYSIIQNSRQGYKTHPETNRWRGRLDRLAACHELTIKEITLRGLNHASPLPPGVPPGAAVAPLYVDSPVTQFEILRRKYTEKGQAGRIPLPLNGSQFWSHHKYSVMARGYQYYKEVKAMLRTAKYRPVSEETELVNYVLSLLEKAPTAGALRNVTDHLWGYFKREASSEEKEHFQSLPPSLQISYLFQLACKYQQTYLLHSTVFADFLNH